MYTLLNYQDIFADFTDRDAKLTTVRRFKIYKPMYYRSDLVTHEKHVFWLMQSLLPAIYSVFGDNFDYTKAQLLAAVHDDPEVIFGDIEAGIKRKMTPEQLAEIDQAELRAIDELASQSPATLAGYSYRDLMREAVGVQTLEARIGKFADRFDAHGESLHEIFAGNRAFITPIVNTWGEIDLPAPFYVRFLREFKEKNPDLAGLYTTGHMMFTPPTTPDYEKIVSSSTPHTAESIVIETSYPHYNFWKQMILESGDQEEIAKLYTQRELGKITESGK